MNPDPDCNCCPPATCETCSPQCSSKPFVSYSHRAERPLKHEPNCGPKNCSIFGSHDNNPPPDLPCPRKAIKMKGENKNSLGSPIGAVASNVNFKTEGKTADISTARYATYLKAFARLHLNDEKQWDSELLDDIMNEGLDLFTNSQNKESPTIDPTMALDIYKSHEQKVSREFELSGFNFQVELMPPFKLKVSNFPELGAKGDGVELTLKDLSIALKQFLRTCNKYGLLNVASFYILFWRSKESYFVFDVCGRRLTDFQTDKDKGVAMLMCFKSLENIRHLIYNLSGLQATDPLLIREVKLVKVVTPQGNIMQVDYGIRNHQYEIINDDYAYLRSDLHLTLNKRDLKHRCGLPVAVAAMVAAKIDHPATWDLKMLDKIICFGVNFCQKRWTNCKSIEAIDVNEFPTTFSMGQFHINIEIKSHCYQGNWRCVPGFKHSELATAIKKAFNVKLNKLILQINQQIYAIWKKQDFIYLFDPYRHRILGKPNESKVYEQMEKSATLRMFRDFTVFMNALNHILLDSNRTSRFSLHFIKVKNIQSVYKPKPDQVREIQEPKLDAYGEVLSLNEHICFEEAEDLCKAALGEISDYEDDDLKSDVDEVELRTSSSEEELLEEEAGAGEVGEMEDIETSSSGEEGGGHKKKTQGKGGKGTGKGTGKGKTKKKGGKKRTKKDKGANDSENESENEDEKKGDNKDDSKTDDKDSKKKKPPKADKSKKGDKTDLDKQIEDDEEGKEKGKEQDIKKDIDKPKEKDKDMDTFLDFDNLDNEKVVKDDKGLGKDTTTPAEDKAKTDEKLKKIMQDLNKTEDIATDATKEVETIETTHKFDEKGSAKDLDKGKTVEVHKKIDKKVLDEDDMKKKRTHICSIPNPNCYPGYLKYPADMAVVGSESGKYESICRLFKSGFKVADRLLLMTPWGNFVLFRCAEQGGLSERNYFLFDGCTCNFDRFRHFDLSVGTAGLICFKHLHNIIEYIRHLRKSRSRKQEPRLCTADDICSDYCNRSFILRM